MDRIVPGKLNGAEQHAIETKYGYQDELMIMSEVYRFWAIESANEKVKQMLSFGIADKGVAIVPDITVFRELKLRLLNGSHTFSCGLAHLAGFDTVKEAMDDHSFSSFITNLMMKEIVPSITTKDLTIDDAKTFAGKVLDRYRNPYIEHHWLSITMQYSSKMRMRNESTIKNYLRLFNTVPPYMALGFAGYVLFMKSVEEPGDKYYGEVNGKKYLINDDSAAYYHELWLQNNNENLVEKVLSNENRWGDDLSTIPGFADAIKNNLQLLMTQGAKKTMENMGCDKNSEL